MTGRGGDRLIRSSLLLGVTVRWASTFGGDGATIALYRISQLSLKLPCLADVSRRRSRRIGHQTAEDRDVDSITWAKKIRWACRDWEIKAGSGSPGNNQWSDAPDHVRLEGDHLFLRLARDGTTGSWMCAEVRTTDLLGFGSYQWWVEAPIDHFDVNVVFGMFTYPDKDCVGGLDLDETNEIDIECAYFGLPDDCVDNTWWTIYPASKGGGQSQLRWRLTPLDGTFTTHRFTWNRQGVRFELLGGHQPFGSDDNLIMQWDDRPSSPQAVPNLAVPLHINLYARKGIPPSDPVEVVLHGFEFHPERGRL